MKKRNKGERTVAVKKQRRAKSLSRKVVFTLAFIVFALYTCAVLIVFLQGFLISIKIFDNSFGIDYGYGYDLDHVKLFSLHFPITFSNYKAAFSAFS